MRVERFDSVESYAAKVASQNFTYRGRLSYHSYGPGHGSRGHDWDAGLGFDQAIHLAKNGDPAMVSKYSDAVDKLVDDYQINQDNRKAYVSSVAGSRVSVPEYLGGSPRCMKRRAVREMSVRSVNVYVATTSWAGFRADDLLKRGYTILALLEYLQMSQVAVELYLTSELDGQTDGDFIQVVKVESHPLDLSTAGFAIAHPAFPRQIMYGMAYVMDGFSGGFARSQYDANYVERLGKAIGMKPGDIYVPTSKFGDDIIISKPEEWLAKHIENIKNIGQQQ